MSKHAFVMALLAGAAALAAGQEIRSYKREELYPGQICADDGTPWEGKSIGDCPQGYNGLRAWAKQRGLLPGSTASIKAANTSTYTVQNTWPYCNPCKDNLACYEFKPGVGKCINADDKASGRTYLPEGATCLDFSGGKKKWTPAAVNPVLFGKSCQWPQFSCNYDAKANNGVYTCQRVRDAAGAPVAKCYRAGGSRWWGGSDQWYALSNGRFVPCGGPNQDYKRCTEFESCKAAAPWPWAE